MSIADKIQLLAAAKTAIAAAITAKGGTVNEGDGFSDFADAIASISSSGGSIKQGTFTQSSAVSTTVNTKITDISEVGFIPRIFIFKRQAAETTTNYIQETSFITVFSDVFVRTAVYMGSTSNMSSTNLNSWTEFATSYLYFDGTNIYYRSSSTRILGSGTYDWIAIQ